MSPRRGPSERTVVSVVFVAAMFMTIMDSTIVNTALPAIAHGYATTTDGVEGVVTGYLVSLAVAIPVSNWLADRLGARRVFLLALAWFTLMSGLCALAWSPTSLVVLRVAQGVGGGMLVPIGTALLFRAYPQQERAAASRVLVVPSVLAPAIGPVLGGLLVDDLSWRWAFLVNLPIGAAALVFGVLFLHGHEDTRAGSFDVPGFLCAAWGFAALLYGLSVGPSHGWDAPGTVAALVAAAVLLVALVLVELRREEPLVAIRRFGDRAFRRASLIAPFSTGPFLGTLYLVPQLLQLGRGQSALQSGLTTFPEAVGVIVCTQISGRIYPVLGPRRLMAGGLTGTAVTLAGMALLPDGVDLWAYRGLMLLLGCAMAFVILPLQTATFAQVSNEATGRASSLFNAIRQLSAALGVAVLASVVGRAPHGLDRFRYALVTAAGLALVGALMSLRFRDSDAASTLNRASANAFESATVSAG